MRKVAATAAARATAEEYSAKVHKKKAELDTLQERWSVEKIQNIVGSCDVRFHHRFSRLFGRWADLMSEVIVEELEVGFICQG